ncbi:hypothetical protein BDZ97DRAFT_1930350 [Flammula alnicola]|nr:hypothetical protein BDZ97DRAFT_1930350 [Flammula alnicola]
MAPNDSSGTSTSTSGSLSTSQPAVNGTSTYLTSTAVVPTSHQPQPSFQAEPLHSHTPDAQRVLLLLDIQVVMLAAPPIGAPASATTDDPLALGWALIFPPHPDEITIDKRKNNAFTGTDLHKVVSPTAEIVVPGFQTGYSIRPTCSAAPGRGNEVLLIRGAHATYDRIEVLHGGGITPASTIVAELEEAGVHMLEMKDLPGIFMDR